MSAKRTLIRLFIPIFVVLVFLSCGSNQNKEADIVAEIEGVGDISYNELYKFYNDYMYNLRYPDDVLTGHREALNSLILRKRKEADFINTGMYRDKALMRPIQRFVNEEIRAEYFEEEFMAKYVNDESIQDYYDEVGKEVRYRQIVILKPQNRNPEQLASVKRKVDEIIAELRNGVDFTQLVREYSQHESVKNDGYMPPVTWRRGSITPINRAIINMNPGSIQALEMQKAFHIINVTSVRDVEMPPLNDIRGTIIKNLREQYLDRALEEYTYLKENIVDENSYNWNEEALTELTKWAKQSGFYDEGYKTVLNEAIENGNNKIIVTLDSDTVDYQEYLYLLNDVLVPGNPEDISKEDLIKFIDDAIRTNRILKEAVDLGYDEQILTENATSILRNHYERIYTQEHILNKIPEATEEALLEFYENHKDSLLYQYARTVVYAKVFETEEEAGEMYNKIQNGQSFEDAANRRYFVKSYIKDKEGNIDSYLSNEEPYFGEVSFEMSYNEVRGPVAFNDGENGVQYAVLKNTRNSEAKVPEYDEVPDIEEQFKEFHRLKISQKVTKHLAEQYPATINDEVLEESVNRQFNE